MIKSNNLRQINRSNLTTISVSHENYQKLKRCGTAGDSFNDVITEMFKKLEKIGLLQPDCSVIADNQIATTVINHHRQEDNNHE